MRLGEIDGRRWRLVERGRAHVVDDADDFTRPGRDEIAATLNAMADGMITGKVTSLELSADDDHTRSFGTIAGVERSPSLQSHAHCAEIIAGDHEVLRGWPLTRR